MKAEKRDRRSERTRRLLGEALTALMLERPYAHLTVQDILDRADIGRSTFYAHYWDKDDLLTGEVELMLEALMREMREAPEAPGTPRTPEVSTMLLPSLGLFRHVGEHARLYRALARGGGLDVALRALRRRLCDDVERELRAGTTLPSMDITVTAQTVVGALLALLQWWMEAEMALSAEQLDAYYARLVMPGVRAAMAGARGANRG